MTTVRSLHDEAMKFAQRALVAREAGDKQLAERFARKAYELERQAAEMVPDGQASEPTRSIMYRSAASLAYQCREYGFARQLIGKALSGFPPPRVQRELDILWEKIRFEENLQERSVRLVDENIEMRLVGRAVSFGQILYSEFTQRVNSLFTLIDRTAQRKMERPYTSSGRTPKLYKPFDHVLASTSAGSFVVNLQLGLLENQQLSLLIDAPALIDEVLIGIELVNAGAEQQLEARIGSEGYYKNFLSLAREIAPDGDQIRFVTFSSRARSFNLTRPRNEIRLVPEAQLELVASTAERNMVRLRGILDHASSRGGDAIGLTTDENGKQYDIVVQKGFEDLVRSYFKKYVVVTGVFDGKKVTPTDIQIDED